MERKKYGEDCDFQTRSNNVKRKIHTQLSCHAIAPILRVQHYPPITVTHQTEPGIRDVYTHA